MKSNTYEMNYINENAIGSYDERRMKSFTSWYGATLTEGIGAVSVYGGLGDSWFGNSYDDITMGLEAMRKNKDCKAIVLFINSPGGQVTGLFDCCDYIKAVNAEKPVYAYVSGMACSAAYAIASSCSKVYLQKDAETGCCGCFANVVEMSEEGYKKEGFLHKVFRSKNAPKKNLSLITDEETSEAFQKSVDENGDRYLAYVADNRGIAVEKAEETFGKGAVVSADYALANGMIDGIISVEELMDEINNGTTSSSLAESEGEDMDITKMSAEEQATLFAQLCEANPSLVAERVEAAKKAENERVSALNELRNGSEAINAIVDAAVADGRSAEAIALDVIKAMKTEAPKANEEARKATLDAYAEGTEVVATPVAKSEDQLIEELVDRM